MEVEEEEEEGRAKERRQHKSKENPMLLQIVQPTWHYHGNRPMVGQQPSSRNSTLSLTPSECEWVGRASRRSDLRKAAAVAAIVWADPYF